MQRVQHIGRAKEEDLGEVDGHVEEVVGELVVLLGVEDLQQHASRVSLLTPLAQLVDLVNQDDWVFDLDLLEGANDLAGDSSEVGPSEALERGSVSVAAQGDAVELAAERLGDGLTDGSFAYSGGADEAEDLALDGVVEFSDGDKLEDALLDLVHAVVALVEDVLGHAEVEVVLGVDAVGHLGEVLQVGLGGLPLAVVLLHLHEALHLLVDDLHDVLRHALALEVLEQLLDVLLLLVGVLGEVLLEALVNLLQLALGLVLVLLVVVLVLQVAPELHLVREVREHRVRELDALAHVPLVVDRLQVVLGAVHEELVGVDVAGHAHTSEDHVDEAIHILLVELHLQHLHELHEAVVGRDLEALAVLVHQELEVYRLLLPQVLLHKLLLEVPHRQHVAQRPHLPLCVHCRNQLGLVSGKEVEHVGHEDIVGVLDRLEVA
mmetsp:Transcript_13182/g.22349  ORF Transcript_13182/g.22349 Transcript_13182/m.22349 type:complete len:435 (-) Transcript_13182:492-1796(-)